MINSNVFDYVNVLQKAADASWVRNDVLANNIANVSTPGYKRQDVDFETQLKRALRSTKFKTVDARVSAINTSELNTSIYTDSSGFSYRLDGNNVDIDTEGTKLAANQIKYNGLIDSINQEFSNLKLVLK
ncbi:MAG: flagellar basal body rod protein FlgB [Lachnospiraceae bacterium]|nr:flagellar basal body rod protein FlgB [Lachnospiraceae bacterium]